MIPREIYKKYQLTDITEYKYPQDFYHTFLIQTDHIPNKIIEAQILGEPTEDYTELLRYRQFARDEINRLEVSE